ncbi:MAG TPA: hypothetical protein VK939_06650 [Longimicrobiales bacterium]|nr:hypothetical protein [Longimicrobiales bacterium]
MRRVEARLHALPDRDRREILGEIRSHVAERYGTLADADAAAAVTADLGSPETCAEAFLAEYGVTETMSPGFGQWRRMLLVAAGVALGLAAITFVVFGLLNVLTPPSAGSVWFIWRDVGLGRYGWLLLFGTSLILAAGAGIGAAALLRRGRRPTP